MKKTTAWPVKAYKNQEFLNSPAARSIRVQCELTEPHSRFHRHGIENTLVFFGSARLASPAQAPRELAQAKTAGSRSKHPNAEVRERLRDAHTKVKLAAYYDQAVELSRRLTAWSLALPHPGPRFYICSGGGPGIMEAANRGAQEAGGHSVGLGISLPQEQGINPYCTPALSFEFHYFFVRKFWFFYLAKALIVFPGGFGTMDELFEVLTLVQTRKSDKHVPIILYGHEYWKQMINFDMMVKWGLISRRDLKLFHLCNSVDEAYEFIVANLARHYRLKFKN